MPTGYVDSIIRHVIQVVLIPLVMTLIGAIDHLDGLTRHLTLVGLLVSTVAAVFGLPSAPKDLQDGLIALLTAVGLYHRGEVVPLPV